MPVAHAARSKRKSASHRQLGVAQAPLTDAERLVHQLADNFSDEELLAPPDDDAFAVAGAVAAGGKHARH